jgi:prevent-host-death family protein
MYKMVITNLNRSTRMADVSTADLRRNLAELVNRVAFGKERVVLTRHGKQVCALVPIEDLSLLERMREAAGRQDVADALEDRSAGESIEWTALRRELGLGG